ncbi:MAG: hypothetical protein ACTHKJ_04765 [Candidatus Nitrosocosmicus sp.]
MSNVVFYIQKEHLAYRIALGFGHVNFNGNLMSIITSTLTEIKSQYVNHMEIWPTAGKSKDGINSIHDLSKSYVLVKHFFCFKK